MYPRRFNHIHVRSSFSKDNKNDFERHIFSQMMRYSILRTVVDEDDIIDYFFDNISKIEHCRRQVLFWLQWHMAKTDQKKFPEAEKLLENSYKEAENFERNTGRPYDRRQLDDQRAKFLMKRGEHISIQPTGLFQDFRESIQITGRLLRREQLTHHPFETLGLIAELFSSRSREINEALRSMIEMSIRELISLAKNRIDFVRQGHQRSTASRMITNTETMFK